MPAPREPEQQDGSTADRPPLTAAQLYRVAAKSILASLPASSALQWRLDPTRHALALSAWRTEYPAPLCDELGRRLLVLQLEMSEWVLRRVEKVTFERDRSVRRSIAIDLSVPEDAPEFVDGDGTRHWLVPLSVMRKRTLVNLELTDENGDPVTTPGIRLSQQLDESMLLAAAAAVDPSYTESAELHEFVRMFVAGKRHEVAQQVAKVEREMEVEQEAAKVAAQAEQVEDAVPRSFLEPLVADDLFMWTFRRLHRGYSLYVFLPVDGGRHRLLTMSFDEPTNWRYEVPRLDRPSPDHPECKYVADDPAFQHDRHDLPQEWRAIRRWGGHLTARLGWKPTRIRFQVPSAELAASYHFEVTAPPGVRIDRATLLAGRPNDPDSEASTDRVADRSSTVGLHAVEVPNGSCCRVQLDLAIPTRGWLTTMVVSSWVILGVLAVVGMPWIWGTARWSDTQVRDLVLVLVTSAAGIAALLTQQEFADLAARLIGPMRVLGTIMVTLPIALAGTLVLAKKSGDGGRAGGGGRAGDWDSYAVPALLGAAVLIVCLVTAAWVRSKVGHRAVVTSPWDMTAEDDPSHQLPEKFWEALRQLGFESPAIGVKSAEAWHEHYRWTDPKQTQALVALKGRAAPSGTTRGRPFCSLASSGCPRTAACPARGGVTRQAPNRRTDQAGARSSRVTGPSPPARRRPPP